MPLPGNFAFDTAAAGWETLAGLLPPYRFSAWIMPACQPNGCKSAIQKRDLVVALNPQIARFAESDRASHMLRM